MQCYECGKPAVAICRWCQVALCRTHLAESLAARTGPHITWCHHVMPSVARPDLAVLPTA
jgi:hypothetical protein